MRKYLLALVICTLTGCASSMPKEVDIPVATCISADIPTRPDLPIAHLTPTSKPDEVIKAYAATVKILQGYIEQLEIKLKATQCSQEQVK